MGGGRFCSYALIGFWYTEEQNATAGRKAFITTRIGDTAFGIAIVWMYQFGLRLHHPFERPKGSIDSATLPCRQKITDMA